MKEGFLFHEYLSYINKDVNKLSGLEYENIVKDYERDQRDINFPLNLKNFGVKLYLKKYIPDIVLALYRIIKNNISSTRSSFIFIINKHKYKYRTIYIAAGNRCAGTWLKEILIMVLQGYTGHHPHTTGPTGGNFDINLSIAENIKSKLYVICSHTPPKSTNINIMDSYLKKYLVTIRDPRDITVSIYYHLKKYPCGPTSFWDYGIDRQLPWPTLSRSILKLEKEEIIDIIIKMLMPSVLRFMEGWLTYSMTNNNILVVKYEDLKTRTKEVIQNILEFYEIKIIDKNKIVDAINSLNPKNSNNIYINYSSGRVPLSDEHYFQPHNDWDRHLTIEQKNSIENIGESFFKKANYNLA